VATLDELVDRLVMKRLVFLYIEMRFYVTNYSRFFNDL